MGTNRTSSHLWQSSTANWCEQIILFPIFDNRAHQTGGNKSYFFPSLTIEHKLVATNRTSSHLWQSSTNWWQQIVLLPIFDNAAPQTGGNKSYFFPSLTLAQTGGNKSYFFPSLTIEHRKLVATNRTSSHLSAQTGGNRSYFFLSLTIEDRKLVATNRTSSHL